jgi:hypothetical protein
MKLDEYVDVAERIRQFKERWPNGSLQSRRDPFVMEVGDRTFIAYCAAAYRTEDDPRPGIGWAWEPVPGPTPFTKDSELMNAETSAWGRAIVALGFETKKIASAEEVRNRSENAAETFAGIPEGVEPEPPTEAESKRLRAAQEKQLKALISDLKKAGRELVWIENEARRFMQNKLFKAETSQLDAAEFGQLIEHMRGELEKEMGAHVG